MNSCPGEDQLRLFLESRLDPESDEKIVNHIEHCLTCEQRISRLQTSGDGGFNLQNLESLMQRSDMVDLASSPRPVQAITAGTIIDHYSVIELRGHGGFGRVFLAEDIRFKKRVAVKLLDGPRGDSTRRDEYLCEANSAAQVKDDHVVEILDVGVFNGVNYIVMEYIDGPSIAEQLSDRGSFKIREVVDIVRQASRGLASIHGKGLVHRDIKPSNLLFESHTCRVKIVDFGLAHPMDSWGTDQIGGRGSGTIKYMSPEQLRGLEPEVRSDLFSMGVVLYQLLTGKLPFEGTSNDDTIKRILFHAPTTPSELNHDIKLDLETICLKCLEKEPAQRYATARELADDLGAFLDDRPIKARPVGQLVRFGRLCRRNRKRAATLTALAVSLVSVAGYIVRDYVRTRFHNAALAESNQKIDSANKNLEAINNDNQRLIAEKSEQVDISERLKRESETRLAASILKKASDALDEGRTGEARRLLDNIAQVPQRTWETRHLRLKAEEDAKWTHRQAIGLFEILACAVDPTEKRIAVSDSDGNLAIMSTEDLRIEKIYGTTRIRKYEDQPFFVPTVWHFLRDRGDAPITSWPENCFTAMAWQSDSKTIIGASLNGSLVAIDTELDIQKELAKFTEPLSAMRLHSSSEYLLLGSRNGTVWRVDLAGKVEFETKRPAAAVSTILWSKSNECWFIGFESGEVSSCDETLEDWNNQFRAPGIVWEMAEVAINSRQLIGVASHHDRIALFDPKTDTAESGFEWINLPGHDSKITDAYTVRQSRDGQLLFAADNSGRLNVIDIAQRRVRYSPIVHPVDGNVSGVAASLAKQPHPMQLLGRMNARVSFVEPIGENRCLTGGQDATVYSVRLPHDTSTALDTNLQSVVGAKPELAFDETAVNRLWALDESGQLTLIDIDTDTVLDSVKAHESVVSIPVAEAIRYPSTNYSDGRSAGIANTVDGIIATVGGDCYIKFWQTIDSKIIPADRPTIELDASMISIAFSKAAGLLAGVDVHAQIRLWKFESGQQAGLSKFGDLSTRPLTGRVAFNRDGTRLAAGGPSQEIAIVDTKTLERVAVKTDVAGDGLVAAAWSDRDPDMVLLADKRGDSGALILADTDLTTENWINSSDLPGDADRRAFAKTSDGRRIAVLDSNGTISFFDSENFVCTFGMHLIGRPILSSMAFDHVGRRLVIATEEGALVLLDTMLPGNIAQTVEKDFLSDLPEMVDSRAQWMETRVVSPEQNRLVCPFAVAYNPKTDKFAVGTIHGRNQFGRLEILIETDNGIVSESPKTSIETADANVKYNSFSLQWREDGALCGWWYGWMGAETMYAGNLIYAVRNSPNNWTIEHVEQMNGGFFPVMFQPHGDKPLEIWHHNMSGLFNLLRSSFDTENGWRTTGQGVFGDGLSLRGVVEGDGNRYLSWVSHRFNVDQSPGAIGIWNGIELKRIPLPANLTVQNIAIGPNGNPVVMVTDYSAKPSENSICFWQLEDSIWKKIYDAPSALNESTHTGKFGFDSNGNLTIAYTDSTGSRILLSSFASGRWSTELVSSVPASSPVAKCEVYFNSNDQPLIAIYNTGPNAWCNVLRKRAPGSH